MKLSFVRIIVVGTIEVLLAVLIFSGIIQSGIYRSAVFLIAAIIEIIIGTLAIITFRKYMEANDYSKWGRIYSAIGLLGFFLPIILGNVIAFLRPIVGVWLIGLFVESSYIFYRIIRGLPITREQK